MDYAYGQQQQVPFPVSSFSTHKVNGIGENTQDIYDNESFAHEPFLELVSIC